MAAVHKDFSSADWNKNWGSSVAPNTSSHPLSYLVGWKDIRYPGIVLPACLNACLLQEKVILDGHIVWGQEAVIPHTVHVYQIYC